MLLYELQGCHLGLPRVLNVRNMNVFINGIQFAN